MTGVPEALPAPDGTPQDGRALRSVTWVRLRELEGRLEWLRRPGPWLWFLLGTGVALRAFLVVMTSGTYDVSLWSEHAAGVAREGLIGHYQSDPLFNHPPAVSLVMTWLWKLSLSSGIPFRILYRAPVALADLASGYLVARVLIDRPQRWLALGAYAVAPVALILSAHHGNTDALIGLCLLACTLLAAARRPLLCGVVLGVGLWIKLPVILGASAIAFAFPRWRDRAAFGLAAVGVGAATYLPAFAAAPALLSQRVFGYAGMYTSTTGGIQVWGTQNFLLALYGRTSELWPSWARVYDRHDRSIALISSLLYAWMRRRENDAPGIGATLAGTFAMFYGLINEWSFQYFAWSMPFWMLGGLTFAMCANLLAGGYIYLLYAYLCGDWLLRPAWDFIGHPQWPQYLLTLRDLSVVTFLAFGLGWLARATFAEMARARAAFRHRSAPA